MRLPSAEARSAFMNSNPVDPIAIAIQEDIGEGDVTTEFFVPAGLHASAQIIAREKAIIAGTETAAGVFHRVDPATRTRVIRTDSSEVEADHLEQVRAFLEIDELDVILLDNMKRTEMREAVALRKNKVKFEASGDITLKNIRQIAATGVDYISVGALTHSAPAINLSLEIRNVTP